MPIKPKPKVGKAPTVSKVKPLRITPKRPRLLRWSPKFGQVVKSGFCS